jgi:hypothetical protein
MARKRRMAQMALPTLEPYDIVGDVLTQKREQLQGLVDLLGGEAKAQVERHIEVLAEAIEARKKVMLDKLV